MKQQGNSCPSPKAAYMALALFGFCAVVGLGLTGEVQACQLALSQSFAPADRVRTGGYDAIRVGRGASDNKKCPRSNDGCDKQPWCPPDATVCPRPLPQ